MTRMSLKIKSNGVFTVALNREELEQLVALVVTARDAETKGTAGWRYWEKLRVRLVGGVE